MATTNKTQLTVTSSGDGSTSEWKPAAMTNNVGAAGGPVKIDLAQGDNTISVPTGAMGMAIVPPASNGTVMKLKGGAGETGFALRTGEMTHVSLPTGTANVLIGCPSGTVRVNVHWT